MTKHEVREAAFIILYQMEITGQAADQVCESTSEEFGMPFSNAVIKLAENVWSSREEIDAIIGKYSPSRSVARISKINLAILRISVYELTFEKEKIPPKVSINEAIELSKAYAENNDKAFINGVLNSYYKDLEK